MLVNSTEHFDRTHNRTAAIDLDVSDIFLGTVLSPWRPYPRGTFVRGMIATNTTRHMDRLSGYPLPRIILDVISSLTDFPNINHPTTAIARSNKYYSPLRIIR